MDLKERFEQYTPQVDPEVWDSVNTTLRRRQRVRKGMVWGALPLVAVGVGLGLYFGLKTTPEVAQAVTPEVTVETVAQTAVEATQPDNGESAVVGAEEKVATATTETAPTKESVPVTVAAAVDNTPAAQTVTPANTNAQKVSETPVRETAVPAVSKPVVSQATSSQSTATKTVVKPTPAQTTSEKTVGASKVTTPVATPEELAFWQPNAFTPDDPNGNNTQWRLTLKEGHNVKSFRIFIYSRTGRMVYKSTDYTMGWNGTANGQPQPNGAYTYVYEYYDIDLGKIMQGKGTITLIR